MQLIVIGNEDVRFYPLLGPFLSRRSVVKELGYSVWDDDGKKWVVALYGSLVLGFVGFVYKDSFVELCSDWVQPDCRKRGTYQRLFNCRLESIGNQNCKATVTDMALSVYLNSGFESVRKNGRYTCVERKQNDS